MLIFLGPWSQCDFIVEDSICKCAVVHTVTGSVLAHIHNCDCFSVFLFFPACNPSPLYCIVSCVCVSVSFAQILAILTSLSGFDFPLFLSFHLPLCHIPFWLYFLLCTVCVFVWSSASIYFYGSGLLFPYSQPLMPYYNHFHIRLK